MAVFSVCHSAQEDLKVHWWYGQGSKQLAYIFALSGAFAAYCEQYYVRVTYSISFCYQLSCFTPYLTWRSSARSGSRRDSHSVCFLRVLIILQSHSNIAKEWNTILSDWKNRRKLQVLFTVCTKEALELLSGFVWGGDEEINLNYFGPKTSLKSYVVYT